MAMVFTFSEPGFSTPLTYPNLVGNPNGNHAQYREICRKDAFGTPVEAIAKSSYDAAGNVVEVRSSRYFESSDSQKD
jgi:hypothetical protein